MVDICSEQDNFPKRAYVETDKLGVIPALHEGPETNGWKIKQSKAEGVNG